MYVITNWENGCKLFYKVFGKVRASVEAEEEKMGNKTEKQGRIVYRFTDN